MRVTRRQWLACGGLSLLTACRRTKATGYPGYALIATSGDKSLGVVDLTSFSLKPAIPLGAAPTAVVPHPSGDRSYVLSPSTGSIHLIDSRLRRAASRRLADVLSEIRVTTDGECVVAVSPGTRELIQVDPVSLRVLARHKLAAEPVALDVVPDPEAPAASLAQVAISTGAHGYIELIDLNTGRRTRTSMLGEIGAVRFRKDGQLVLAANLQDRSLSALSVPDLQTVAELPLAMKPENLCFNFDFGQLFVSGEGMDAVAIVFPYMPLEVEQTILAGRDPGVMACSESPGDLFVASQSGSDVCILNIDTRKMLGVVEVGLKPTYITTTPDSQYALILDELSGDMAVIRIPAIRTYHAPGGSSGYWLPRLPASLFTMLPVGEKPVQAAIIPRAV
jgi:DNA-binding beta-propeller fold protein YncE